jgi:hypothetical protein
MPSRRGGSKQKALPRINADEQKRNLTTDQH